MRARYTLLIVLCASSAAVAVAPYRSWGKAGVTIEQYRSDAVACGRLGANADIRDNPATEAFAAAERWSDRNLNVQQAGVDPIREQAQMVARLKPEKRLAEVQQTHVSTTERCLTRLGYRRFALTAVQTQALGKLPMGSAARHAFLHGLASDPAVLSRQAVDDR